MKEITVLAVDLAKSSFQVLATIIKGSAYFSDSSTVDNSSSSLASCTLVWLPWKHADQPTIGPDDFSPLDIKLN
ncbi:MAG: hypothetical protein M3Q07_18630 [Pseudobdellovibrionaceae bacterium]|nr:hypothetical protein [Pseudobdellovibrionaceae bacterium]